MRTLRRVEVLAERDVGKGELLRERGAVRERAKMRPVRRTARHAAARAAVA